MNSNEERCNYILICDCIVICIGQPLFLFVCVFGLSMALEEISRTLARPPARTPQPLILFCCCCTFYNFSDLGVGMANHCQRDKSMCSVLSSDTFSEFSCLCSKDNFTKLPFSSKSDYGKKWN